MQVKLLRAIQEKKVRKVGSTQEDPVDVRIISATHQKLGECVEAGKFRHDLYYRLNVIELRMPALREMREDIPQFVSALLDKLARNSGARKPEVTPEALEDLERYDFPGNVRELENVLERAMALCSESRVTADDLQLTPEDIPEHGGTVGGSDNKAPLQDYLDRVEKEAILDALEKTRYNRTAAAKLLGITFRSMRYRMERLGLN
jgi:two-component system response regulator PilR (NtrC family)